MPTGPAQAYLQTVGCTDAATALQCLRGKSSAELLAAQAATPIGVRPSVGDAAFPLDPAVAVESGRINRVPLISGQVENERSLFVFQLNDYAGKPVTPAGYEATIRAAYGADADKVLAAYPLSAFPSPSAALARVQSDAATYGRLRGPAAARAVDAQLRLRVRRDGDAAVLLDLPPAVAGRPGALVPVRRHARRRPAATCGSTSGTRCRSATTSSSSPTR